MPTLGASWCQISLQATHEPTVHSFWPIYSIGYSFLPGQSLQFLALSFRVHTHFFSVPSYGALTWPWAVLVARALGPKIEDLPQLLVALILVGPLAIAPCMRFSQSLVLKMKMLLNRKVIMLEIDHMYINPGLL